MLAAGMNDYSGQFAYRIGLPAKSGISGGLMVIVPNVMGIGLYSPCVDDSLNSVRSLEFIEQFVDQFRFHQFEPLRRRASVVNSSVELNDVEKAIVNLLAAQRNDVNRLIISFLENQDLNRHNDYDGSTLLHVAAGHNSFEAVEFLVEKAGVDIEQRDRHGKTALDHAIYSENEQITNYLQQAKGLMIC